MHGEFDFETYSEAGHEWVPASQIWDPKKERWKEVLGRWKTPAGAGNKKKGLGIVGAAAYAEHPSTEALTLSYRFPAWWSVMRGLEVGRTYRWRPGQPNPQELFDYFAAGGVMEAHNAMFERLIWEKVCVPKYGWPSHMPWFYQLRCSMAKARVAALPGPLGELAAVLGTQVKDPEGKRLLDKFSVPRNPTQKNPSTRTRPEDEPAEFELLCLYCDRDVDAEGGASAIMPDMSADELTFWWVDQEINWRGVGVDTPGILDCIAVLEQALEQYGEECREITGFGPGQLDALKGWLHANGVHMDKMDQDAVDEALERLAPHPPGGIYKARRVLEIRQLIGSASVKKLYAMNHQRCADNRLRNLIVHHGARTGRPTGEGPQPLNLPKAGPDLRWCGMDARGDWTDAGCRRPFKTTHTHCPWCAQAAGEAPVREWSPEASDYVLEAMGARSLELVEWYFGDAVLCISGCIRALFVAAPGHDLIASDYSSIESVVTAMLAGEEWRIEAFQQNKPMYLLGASMITGTPLETYLTYAKENKSHHPDRQKIGKVSELACGFGGWIGSFWAFDFDGSDEEAKQIILGWRRASPKIVEMWGGQRRRGGYGRPDIEEYYGLEGCAVQAIRFPGTTFETNGVAFYMRGDALIVRLPSGREMTYHQPRLSPSSQKWAAPWEMSITYMTWNTNPKYGPKGWVPMKTYGGRLTENIVQAVAHDILRFAILNLRAAGYPTVLHIYDEIVVEAPHGLGSIEEVERIMGIMPPWAAGWPIRAGGGWRGRRYRKG